MSDRFLGNETSIAWKQDAAEEQPVIDEDSARTGDFGLYTKDLTVGPLTRNVSSFYGVGLYQASMFVQVPPAGYTTSAARGVVKLRILDLDGKVLGSTKAQVDRDGWAELTRTYDPGWYTYVHTCNGKPMTSWTKSRSVVFELSYVGKAKSPMRLSLDDVNVTFVKEKQAKSKTSTSPRS